MKDKDGKALGTITLTETAQGVLLNGELTQIPPGPHGFHIHAVGKCEPPFTSAGGHFNPDNKKHGFHEASGSHAGDLPNLHAAADGKAVVDAITPGLTLTGGGKSLFDQDGAALVIHAKPTTTGRTQRATRATASSAGLSRRRHNGPGSMRPHRLNSVRSCMQWAY